MESLFGKTVPIMPDQTNSISPQKIIWKKFRKDYWAVSGLILIAICIVISILGYSVTPDSTPNADKQCLEIALAPPLSKVNFVRQQKSIQTSKVNFFKKLISGAPSDFIYIPVKNVTLKGDSIILQTYVHFNKNIFIDKSVHYPSEKINPVPVSKYYFLGTDRFGRDVLSRLMIGTRITMMVGFIAVIISLVIGIGMGAIAGYYRGWPDRVISWLMNVVWSIPTLLLVLTITISIGKGLLPVFVAVGLTMWVDVARIVRGEVFSVREREFVTAGKALGFRTPRIIFLHILPNIMASVLVIASSNFASAILIESGLSFLGLGAQPPTPTWGNMIESHRNFITTPYAHLALIPGFAIMLLVLAFTMVSNGLKNAMDKK